MVKRERYLSRIRPSIGTDFIKVITDMHAAQRFQKYLLCGEMELGRVA